MNKEPRIAVHDRRELNLIEYQDAYEYVDDEMLARFESDKTCEVCASKKMKFVAPYTECHGLGFSYVIQCQICGYWDGIAYTDNGPFLDDYLVGVKGRIRDVPLTTNGISTPDLLRHLINHESHLTKLSPFRAENFVSDLLADWFSCEVKPVGGIKDGGVDAYILRNDEIASIVQVKWRQHTQKAESISVVRELAGTLLVKGIPSGFLITTRDRFSSQADAEITKMNGRHVDGIGCINIEYKVYNDIIDMIELSHRKLSETPKIVLPNVAADDIDALFSYESSEELIVDPDLQKLLSRRDEQMWQHNASDMHHFLMGKTGSSIFEVNAPSPEGDEAAE